MSILLTLVSLVPALIRCSINTCRICKESMGNREKEEAEDEMGKVVEGWVKEDLAGLVEFFLPCFSILFCTRYIRKCAMITCAKVPPTSAGGWVLSLYL